MCPKHIATIAGNAVRSIRIARPMTLGQPLITGDCQVCALCSLRSGILSTTDFELTNPSVGSDVE